MCCYLWHNRNLTRQNVKFVCFANKFFLLIRQVSQLTQQYVMLQQQLNCLSIKTLNDFIVHLHNIIQFLH